MSTQTQPRMQETATTPSDRNSSFKILIGGFDGAGKSTLACSLYVYLLTQGHEVGLHELDPWSDTHAPLLGHKDWLERTKRTGFVDQDIYSLYVDPFIKDRREIVIGDIQGNYQYAHNNLWAGTASAAVLVSRHATEKDEWRRVHESRDIPGPQTVDGWYDLLQRSGISYNNIIRVHSLRHGQTVPISPFPVIAAHQLERALVPFHPAVVALADQLLHLRQLTR